MNCAKFEDLILERIDGELSPVLAARLEHHLAGCESCQAFLSAASEMDSSIAHFARQPSLEPQFAFGVLRKINRARPRLPGVAWDFAGIAAVAVAGAFCTWHLVPDVMFGAGWLAAAVIVCGGMCIAVADAES